MHVPVPPASRTIASAGFGSEEEMIAPVNSGVEADTVIRYRDHEQNEVQQEKALRPIFCGSLAQLRELIGLIRAIHAKNKFEQRH
jgi:hypothetical protein